MSEYFIGLMSGTSMDGIDAVLVNFADNSPTLVCTHHQAWPETTLNNLRACRELSDDEVRQLNTLDDALGEQFAKATNQLLKKAGIAPTDIIAIGSHGQTVRHCPDATKPFSLQLGKAQTITEHTGIKVVSDFRTADMQAGGQGAPLVPAFHQTVFRNKQNNRVIVNIGGIANITVLPKDFNQDIIGFDTGPGNNLMDAWVMKQHQQTFDNEGAFAASGKTNALLLANLLSDDYFSIKPPKSTGFEKFNLAWLEQYLDNSSSTEDVQSTLCDLTATSIIRAINQYAIDTDEIFICGGGASNTELMKRLKNLTGCPVESTQQLGIDPNWIEAMAFAWLAKRTLKGESGNLPSVTGASKEVVLGAVTYI